MWGFFKWKTLIKDKVARSMQLIGGGWYLSLHTFLNASSMSSFSTRILPVGVPVSVMAYAQMLGILLIALFILDQNTLGFDFLELAASLRKSFQLDAWILRASFLS